MASGRSRPAEWHNRSRDREGALETSTLKRSLTVAALIALPHGRGSDSAARRVKQHVIDEQLRASRQHEHDLAGSLLAGQRTAHGRFGPTDATTYTCLTFSILV